MSRTIRHLFLGCGLLCPVLALVALWHADHSPSEPADTVSVESAAESHVERPSDPGATPRSLTVQGHFELTGGADSVNQLVRNARRPVDARRRAAHLLAQARSGEISLLAFRRALEALAQEGGSKALCSLLLTLEPGEEALAFQAAVALSRHLPAPLAEEMLGLLPVAPEHVRPHLVTAIGGSPLPAVDRRLGELYRDVEESPAVRIQAAFQLAAGGRIVRLSPAERDPVVRQAQHDLSYGEVESLPAAADVLGAAPLDPRERSQLEQLVRQATGQPERRLAALRALATSGATIADLNQTLEQVADDTMADPQLRQLAQELLGQ